MDHRHVFKSTLLQILQLIFDDQQSFNLQFLSVKNLYENFFQKKDLKFKYNFLSFDQLLFGYENEIIENWKQYRSLIADEIENIILAKTVENSFIKFKIFITNSSSSLSIIKKFKSCKYSYH